MSGASCSDLTLKNQESISAREILAASYIMYIHYTLHLFAKVNTIDGLDLRALLSLFLSRED